MIDIMSYIIADTHFGHKNISTHEPIRKAKAYENGFNDVDELMIHNWNKTVTDNDTVFHLGDFAFKNKNLAGLANQLNGNKILLVGNHDKQKDVDVLRGLGWSIIDDIVLHVSDREQKKLMQKLNTVYGISSHKDRLLCCYVLDIEDQRIMFTHFPLFNDNPYDKKYNPITEILEYIFKELQCDLNIHGHTHSHGAKESYCISACVELTNFKPIPLNELIIDNNTMA